MKQNTIEIVSEIILSMVPSSEKKFISSIVQSSTVSVHEYLAILYCFRLSLEYFDIKYVLKQNKGRSSSHAK